jgi:hypothetical protein
MTEGRGRDHDDPVRDGRPGPPDDWLERVRRAAPGLLLGTPWAVPPEDPAGGGTDTAPPDAASAAAPGEFGSDADGTAGPVVQAPRTDGPARTIDREGVRTDGPVEPDGPMEGGRQGGGRQGGGRHDSGPVPGIAGRQAAHAVAGVHVTPGEAPAGQDATLDGAATRAGGEAGDAAAAARWWTFVRDRAGRTPDAGRRPPDPEASRPGREPGRGPDAFAVAGPRTPPPHSRPASLTASPAWASDVPSRRTAAPTAGPPTASGDQERRSAREAAHVADDDLPPTASRHPRSAARPPAPDLRASQTIQPRPTASTGPRTTSLPMGPAPIAARHPAEGSDPRPVHRSGAVGRSPSASEGWPDRPAAAPPIDRWPALPDRDPDDAPGSVAVDPWPALPARRIDAPGLPVGDDPARRARLRAIQRGW